MSYLLEKHVNDFFRDMTSLGGLWVYLLLVAFTAVLISKPIALQLLLSLIITYILAISIRLIYFKERPAHEQHTTLLERIDASAFPSIHAARASAAATIFSLFYPQTQLFAISITILVCISRIVLRKHDSIDVIAGSILGILAAYGLHVFLN